MILRYDSTASLRSAYIAHNRQSSVTHFGMQNSWYGGESEERTLAKAEVGDTSLVPAAEALLSQLDTAIETPRRVFERSPVGSYYAIPEVIAGLPTCARRQVTSTDDRAPITILAITTSSAGISADTLQKRGIVILALVMALSRTRPVALQQLTILDGTHEGETIITSEINTSPLDLATACYVLTSAGFARRLTYGLARAKNNFVGNWPRNFDYFKPERYYASLKPRLVADPTKCLIIGAAQMGDELLAQPLAWIGKQINHFTASQEEELLH